METIKIRKTRSDKGIKRMKVIPIATVEPEQTVPKVVTLIENPYRNKLQEGRSYGIGFAFCKRDGCKFTGVGPISPCKDYLNDQIYSERTGKPFRAYGYDSKKTDCFEVDYGFIAMGICPYKYGERYTDKYKETKYLEDNYKVIGNMMAQMDNDMTLANQTQIHKCDINGRYIVSVPAFWCEFPYRISLYTLIIRIAIESEYGVGKVEDMLEKCTTGDSTYAYGARKKLLAMFAGTRPVFDFNSFNHSYGISAFAFPST